MRFEFGAVVLVPFPFTNQTASKKRPAVVVSNGAYNTARPDVVMMAITTNLASARTSTVGAPIQPERANVSAGPPRSST